MYSQLESIRDHDIEDLPKIYQVNNIDITILQEYSTNHKSALTSIQGIIWICLIEIIMMTIFQIGFYYSILPVWTLIMVFTNASFLIQLFQWFYMFIINIKLLCKMGKSSSILTYPIKKILCVCCFNILHHILNYAFFMLYCFWGLFSGFQYKIVIFGSLVILHCIISFVITCSEKKIYEQFEIIVLQRVTLI